MGLQVVTPPIIYHAVTSVNTLSSSETQANDAEDTKKDEAVLSQIGEDPGLSPDTIEQDSKAMDHKENRQGKDRDRTKTKD